MENDSLYNNDFSDEIKGVFQENDELVALTIYSYDTGVEYFYSRNNQIKIKAADEAAAPAGAAPEYRGIGFVHRVGTIPLTLADKPGTSMDGIFTVLPRGSVFFVLRVSLIVVIVLFFVTLILIVAFSMSSSGKSSNQAPEEDWSPGEEPGGAPESRDMEAEPADFSAPEDLNLETEDDLNFDAGDSDFSLPDSDESFADSGDSFDDSFPEEESPSISDESLDDLDFSGEDSFDLDDMNLEETIPDIPEEEDLLAMDHQEASVPMDDENLDDFDLPVEEPLDDLGEETDFAPDLAPQEDESPLDGGGEQSSLYNPDSGLGWEHFLEERLSLELERAASFDQDLVLIMVRNDQVDSGSWEQLTAMLREKYSYSDLVFEAGKNELAIIDPNKDLDESISDVQNLLKSFEETINDGSTIAGLSSRNGRLISGGRLIREAGTSLNKADGENPIVGFRSDPERFREFLGQNS